MSDSATMQVIEAFSAVLLRSDPSVTDETQLEWLGMDSLDQTELLVQIEDRLGVEVTPQEYSNLTTVADLINLVRKKLPNAN